MRIFEKSRTRQRSSSGCGDEQLDPPRSSASSWARCGAPCSKASARSGISSTNCVLIACTFIWLLKCVKKNANVCPLSERWSLSVEVVDRCAKLAMRSKRSDPRAKAIFMQEPTSKAVSRDGIFSQGLPLPTKRCELARFACRLRLLLVPCFFASRRRGEALFRQEYPASHINSRRERSAPSKRSLPSPSPLTQKKRVIRSSRHQHSIFQRVPPFELS
jgi:hypothetical protein